MRKNIKALSAIFSNDDASVELVYEKAYLGRTYTKEFASVSAMLNWLKENNADVAMDKIFTIA